jgi:hypothetical protein
MTTTDRNIPSPSSTLSAPSYPGSIGPALGKAPRSLVLTGVSILIAVVWLSAIQLALRVFPVPSGFCQTTAEAPDVCN